MPQSTRRARDLWVAGILFVIAVLFVNSRLFFQRIYEDDDLAANAIQVQDAKHFHGLVGNYSRWNYHHPGPAALYILAAGEAVFYDALHLAPTPLNAEFLIVIIFNSALLFLALGIFRGFHASLMFPAVAMAAAVFFIWTINHTIWGSALVSAWPPHLLLFPFLLFLILCAAVWSAHFHLLPWLSLTGMFLFEVHVSMAAFVAVLGGAAVVGALYRETRTIALKTALGQHRREFLWAFLAALLLAFPMLVEASIHHPNNFSKILDYVRANPGLSHSAGESIRYFLTFPLQILNPEEVIGKVRLWSAIPQVSYARIYFVVFPILPLLAVAVRLRTGRRLSPFSRALIAEMCLTSLVFLYWGMKITGPLYNYLGFTIYSLQLLTFWISGGYVLDSLPGWGGRKWVAAASLGAATLSVLLLGDFIRNQYKQDPEVFKIANAVPAMERPTQIDIDPVVWVPAAGVVSWLKRENKHYCIPEAFGTMLGEQSVCRGQAVASTLLFSEQPISCAHCRTLAAEDEEYATLAEGLDAGGPFTIGPAMLKPEPKQGSDSAAQECFDLPFRFPAEVPVTGNTQLNLAASGVPARRWALALNGMKLEDGASPNLFVAPSGALKPGVDNMATICGESRPQPPQPSSPNPPSQATVVTFRDTAGKTGFFESGPAGQWTSGHASIQFKMDDRDAASTPYKLEIEGSVLPNRPATVSMNGKPGGQVVADSGAAFVLSPGILQPGSNQLFIDVPAAGPVGNDPRPLGFGFTRMSVAALQRATLPLLISAADSFDAKRGFFAVEGTNNRWTTQRAIVEFAVVPVADAQKYKLRIETELLPGREATVVCNGSVLGPLSPTGITEFHLAANQMDTSQIIHLEILSPDAGPWRKDPRQLGAMFHRITLAVERTATLTFVSRGK